MVIIFFGRWGLLSDVSGVIGNVVTSKHDVRSPFVSARLAVEMTVTVSDLVVRLERVDGKVAVDDVENVV
jgi:hypothetical protein